MQSDILFDNIFIGHSIADAEKFADETFNEKHSMEQLLELAEKPKEPEKPKSPMDLVFMDDPVEYIKVKLDLFFTIAQKDPIEAIKFVPEAAGGLAAVAITFIAIIVGIVSMSGSTPPPAVKKVAEKAETEAAEVKDKATDATTSAVEPAKGEVNKRTKRSTS